MPVDPLYNTRHGGPTIMRLAQGLCLVVNRLAPIARVAWADRPAFLAVLDATVSVCALLPAAMSEQALMDAPTADQFDPPDA